MSPQSIGKQNNVGKTGQDGIFSDISSRTCWRKKDWMIHMTQKMLKRPGENIV